MSRPHVEIYGRPNCSWCDRAKELCRIADYPFRYVDLIERPEERQELKRRMGDTPLKTVPQIFLGRRYVGGFVEFEAAHKRGEIQQFIGGQ